MPRDCIRRPGGRVRPFRAVAPDPRHWVALGPWRKNLVLDEWAAVIGPLLGSGLANYRLSAMYLEFANVAAPGDVVTPPGLSRGAGNGAAYYQGLSGSATRDYLRVPLAATTFVSTDAVNFPRGNLLTCFAMTAGVAGVGGKPFSDANNSVVFGCALVATPDAGDASQDLVFSRFYFPTDEQLAKLAGSQIGIAWEQDFQ